MRWLLVFVLLSSLALAQPLDSCTGCSYSSRCISQGSQIKTDQGVMFCSDYSVLYPAKPDSSSCFKDYECLSFVCTGGICQPINPEVLVFDLHSNVFFPSVAIGLLLLASAAFLFVKSSKYKARIFVKPLSKASPKSKQSSPSSVSSVRIVPIKRKYSQFDKLDRQIEAAAKRIVKK